MTKQERDNAYQARLQERLERVHEDAEYSELRLRAGMPYDQQPAMSLRDMATALSYVEFGELKTHPGNDTHSVHVDRLNMGRS